MANKMMIDDLNLYYGQFHALKDISLNIQEKEITAFIGPSGCGKSTLLKSLNRMNDLVEGCKITGQVTLDGTDIYRDLDVNLLRKRVGMVFQKPNPFPMSIYDNVAYGARTHGIRSKAKLDQIVEEALRGAAIWDELKDRLKKSALGLSGGQQQPVARDLRNISAALKMVTDMERIGDHATDISELAIVLSEKKYVKKLDHIEEMARETMVMLIQSLEAYVEKDLDKAQKVIAHDDVIDDLFEEVKQELIELIRNHADEGEQAVDLLMVTKYFERIGDHATNIAEWVIFSITGQIAG